MTVDPTAATSNTGGKSSAGTKTTNPGMELNENAFLQLMITQLQHQDPLSPQDPSAYLSQLAQFTSVEQETQTAQNTAGGTTANAVALLGHTVTYANADGSAASGTVSAVDLTQNGSPTLTVGTVTGISPTQVTEVS